MDLNVFKSDLLKGKNVFITGGASGIGAGIVKQFAQVGANVAIASRRQELCENFANEIKSDYGIDTVGIGLDVRSSADVSKAMNQAADKLGGIDILINNAAGNFYWPAEKMRDKLWHAVIDIDLNGTFYCCRSVFKHMKENGGVILSTSMTLHYNGWQGMAHATAAKSGIDGLTKTLAVEWAPFGIRVNAVAPGPIVTEGVEKAFAAGGSFETFKDVIPLGRPGEPEEIGSMMVYLASPAGNWITGNIFVVDGGESLSPQRPAVTREALQELLKNRKSKS